MSGKTKRIVVVGMGQFGGTLAKNLARYCEVLALDADEARVNALVDEVQRALILDARDHESLRAAVDDDFDEAVIAVGDCMETSVLCALHLRKIGVGTIRAKAVSDDHAAVLRAVGVTQIIFPERETAQRIAAQIVNPNMIDFLPLEGDYSVVELAAPGAFQGKSLRELDVRNRYGIFVIAVRETAEGRTTLLPDPDFKIKPSDTLLVFGRQEHLAGIRQDEAEGEAEADDLRVQNGGGAEEEAATEDDASPRAPKREG